MLNHDTSFIFISCWILCWAVAYSAVYVLLLPTNKSTKTINTWIITLGISVLIGIAFSFKIMTALSLAFILSELQVTIIRVILLLTVIVGTLIATKGLFRVMKETAGNFTTGYH